MENQGKLVVSTHDLFPVIVESLSTGHQVKFTVSGNSMRPWIVDNRDQVLLVGTSGKRLKIGDIILFQTNYGKYILHRIYKYDKDGYRTLGDGCLSEDGFISSSDIIGKAIKIYRKGKIIDCNSLIWRYIFWMWLKLLPIRKPLLNLYHIFIRLKGKLKKRLIHLCNSQGANEPTK